MDYSWYSRQSLHEMLNENLSKSRKECSRLHGSISKLKSGQAVLMTRRDRAKTDLESYVNKLSTALLDFQSEMLLTIREALSTKLNDLDKLRERYEESINSHLQLCNEAEKLTQFGRDIESQVDKNAAVKILQKFKNMMECSSGDGHFDDIMKLEFYPALQCTEIKPPMFGDLVVGRCYKSPTSALSGLRAQDCGLDQSNKVTDEKKTTKSTDITTQTEDDCIQKSPITSNNTEQQVTDKNNNRSVVTTSQSCSMYNRLTPPPGMMNQTNVPINNYTSVPINNPASVPINNRASVPINNHASVPINNRASVPINNRTSPPPGFNVFTPTINTMQANMQMNPYLLNNNYLCNPMPFVPQYPAVSPTYQPVHVPLVYQFGDANATSNFAFKAQQPSIASYAITSPSVTSCRVSVTSVASYTITSPSVASCRVSLTSVASCSVSALSVAPCSVSASSVSSRSAKRNIASIPLPPARNISSIPLPPARNNAKCVTMATSEKSCVRNIDFPDASVCKTSDSSTKENSNNLNDELIYHSDDSTDKSLGGTSKVVDNSPGDATSVDHGKRKRYEVASQLFHSLVQRTGELDLEENDNKIDPTPRRDECETSVKPSETDNISAPMELNDTGRNTPSDVNNINAPQMTGEVRGQGITGEVRGQGITGEVRGQGITGEVRGKGRGSVQSGFCSDLRERIAKRQPVNFEIKPLRKPFLQQTDNLLNSRKTTEESETTTSGKSLDGSQSEGEGTGTSTDCHISSNQPASNSMSSKPVSDNLNPNIEHKKVDVDKEDPQAPDVLDISSHKVKTLRELVSTNYPPSKKEVEQRSKEILLAQRSWFKGYMQKNLENRKIDKKEDKKLVDEGWKDVKIKCENMEQTVSKLDHPHESSDSFKEVEKSAVDDSKFDEVKCEISDDKNVDIKSDWEVESVTVEANLEGTNQEGNLPSHESKYDSSVEILDKGIDPEKGVTASTENKVQGNITADTKKEETKPCDKETDKQLQDKSEAAKVAATDSVNKQAEKVVEKNIETTNIDSTPRSKSDVKKDVCKRSPASCSQRLGTLQAHWVARRGTNVKAKHLFTCSSELHFPIGVTSNSSGDIIVADTGNHCLKMFDSAGKFVKAFGKTASPSLRRPSDVVVNEFDNIYVKDDRAVRVFDHTGHYVKSIGSNLFSKPFENKKECDIYDDTTTVETDDETLPVKRPRKKRQFDDYIVGPKSDRCTDEEPSPSASEARLPSPPRKVIKKVSSRRSRSRSASRSSFNTQMSQSRSRSPETVRRQHKNTSRSRSASRSSFNTQRSQSRSQSPITVRGSQSRLRSPVTVRRSRSPVTVRQSKSQSRSPVTVRRSKSQSRSPISVRGSKSRLRSPVTVRRSRSPVKVRRSKSQSRSSVTVRRSKSQSRSPIAVRRSKSQSGLRSPVTVRRSKSQSRSPVTVRRLSVNTHRSRSPPLSVARLSCLQKAPSAVRSLHTSLHKSKSKNNPSNKSKLHGYSQSSTSSKSGSKSLSQRSTSHLDNHLHRSPLPTTSRSTSQDEVHRSRSKNTQRQHSSNSRSKTQTVSSQPMSSHTSRSQSVTSEMSLFEHSPSCSPQRKSDRSMSPSIVPLYQSTPATMRQDGFPMSNAKFQKRVLYLLADVKADLKDLKTRRLGGADLVSFEDETEHGIGLAYTMEEFTDLESRCKIPQERQKLVQKLSTIGGHNPKDIVRKIMERLMTNELMSSFNMKGGGHKTRFNSSPVCEVVTGLVLTPTKCLLVLETDWNHPSLVHISQDGSHVWKYLYTPLTTAPPNSKCRFMTVSENNVLVSDLGLSVVYITTFEGTFLRTVGRYGFGMQDFYEPSGLSVDIYGNVVIGDSKNNRVQVYRHDGSYTCMIEFDDKIVRPSGLHLTKDNRLIVVSLLKHTVQVYELL